MAAHGAAKVSVYVTHAVFPKHSYERFTHKDDGNSSSIFVDDTSEILIANLCISNSNECYQRPGSEKAFTYFWITDSCPLTVKAIGNRAPFEVLSLAGSIADALQI